MDIIDQNQLNECMTGDIELDRDLIQVFLTEITQRIADMRQACDNDNQEAWRTNAHRSLGASATLGFRALADTFRIAEHQIFNREERTAWLIGVMPNLDQTRNALHEIGLL
jgi:HPt (histidine-containing phosphotransfer) domain-containing protein